MNRRLVRTAIHLLLMPAILAGSARSSQGKPPSPSALRQLDQRLAAAIRAAGIPGAAVAIIENRELVFLKGYGLADREADRRVTPDTVFRAGSIAKSLTGIAIMRLVEQGKLALEDRLADLAPEIEFENPWEATDPLRLVHLLEHTTGWPDISLKVLVKDEPDWSLRRGVVFASNRFVSRWKPGRFSTYNNAGPAVAGLILEKVTGLRFSAYLRDEVLRPMGMAHADFELTPELRAELSKSYAAGGAATPYQSIILAPSGSLATSVRDLARLVLFLLHRGALDGRRILTPASIERIERQETSLAARAGLTNGYGLGNASFPGDRWGFRGHNGGIDSFTSVYGYATRHGSGFVLLANGGDGVDLDTPISNLITAYLSRAVRLEPPPPYAVAREELEANAGYYALASPPYEFLRIYAETLLMALRPVSVREGRLLIGGVERVPAGAHIYRRADALEPSLAFIEHDGERWMATGLNTSRREPLAVVVPKLAVVALLSLGLVAAVLSAPFHLIGWLRGRLRERGGGLVRMLPLAALIALLATFVLPLVGFVSQDPGALRGLARPSLPSLAILGCSLAFPLLAALGLWLSWRRERLGGWVRLYVRFVCVLLLIAAIYAARYGWIGVRTWTW
jgi:CubicO group peptidase (beta-lactamase class C family)